MKKLTADRKMLRVILMTAVLCLILSIPASAQESADSRDETWNIAVIGVYTGGGANKAEYDFAAVVEIDRETLELKMEYIPEERMNDAEQDGGPVNRDLGIHYDDYVIFNWKDVVDGINILGGVDTVISDEEYVYINAYLTQTVADTGVASTWIKEAGQRHMDGVQAVAYGRLKLSENDPEQLLRQRRILSLGWKELTQTDIGSLYNIVRYVLPSINTSLDADKLTFLYKNGREWVQD